MQYQYPYVEDEYVGERPYAEVDDVPLQQGFVGFIRLRERIRVRAQGRKV